MRKVVPGETLELTQKDGEQIQIIVYETGFLIKAPDSGMELAVDRDNVFLVRAKTVKAKSTQLDTNAGC